MPNTYYVTYGNNVLTAGAAGSAISVNSHKLGLNHGVSRIV